MTTKSSMECPDCGEILYRVRELCTDRDGIREDAWCETCHVMFGVRCNGYEKRFVLKDKYSGTAKERVLGLVEAIKKELT